MSAAAETGARPAAWISGRRLADRALFLAVFSGGFVIYEPSPYELVLFLVILFWAFAGLKLNRHVMPMAALMVLYVVGGLLSLTQMSGFGSASVYLAITAFLAVTSVFYAALVGSDPSRLRVVGRAYVAAAVIASLLGVAGYFHLFPGSEIFTRYGRAMGPFQDPNVFGPFLLLPFLLLVQTILSRRLRESVAEIGWALVILAGVFLSFSRAAWAITVFGTLFLGLLAYVNAERQRDRFRLVAYALGGFIAIALLLAVALSIPAVQEVFAIRARLVQDYDAAQEAGRFENHILGFFLVLERPFGVGPYQFGLMFGADEHNTWLKGFTVYGWLGGFSYFVLVLWTLRAATPLLFRRRPWQPFLAAAYAAYLGHLILHNVIDNDHWRHLFLLYGVLWGCVAADRMERRRRPLAAPPLPALFTARAALPRARPA